MSADPAVYPATTSHPQWCSPLRCHDTGRDSEHCAEPSSLTRGGQRFDFALRQLDEHAFPAEPGETRLRIDITELEWEDCACSFEVPIQHLDAFIARLTIERHRARFQAAPVVREVAS